MQAQTKSQAEDLLPQEQHECWKAMVMATLWTRVRGETHIGHNINFNWWC